MEPTREQLDKAWHLEGATPAIIAEALADEFAKGAISALEKLELHQITDAACKRATADGLEITIRVKQLAKPAKRKGKR